MKELVDYFSTVFDDITYYEQLFEPKSGVPLVCIFHFKTDKTFIQIYNLVLETECGVVCLSKMNTKWILTLEYYPVSIEEAVKTNTKTSKKVKSTNKTKN